MKIGVIGAGMVGATAAYAMVMRGVGREIVLVDRDRKLSEAQAQDEGIDFRSLPRNPHPEPVEG